MNIRWNKLNGEVPLSIFNLSKLQVLCLHSNELSGNLPSTVSEGLPNIEEIYLWGNKFSGKIPTSISNLSGLTILSINDNLFNGTVPITFGNLRSLRELRLFGNQFTNDLSIPEQDFLTPLTNCKYLRSIQINSNPIKGMFPKLFFAGNMSRSLQILRAYNCSIRGSIPTEIGNLSSLILLNIGENYLNGMLPSTLGQLTKLQKLLIDNNYINGIPFSSLCNMESLFYANLTANKFFGMIPVCLANLTWLREIYLSNNAFRSNIQSSFWFNRDIEIISFSGNFFYGSLPEEIGNFKSLRELDISGNQLSGIIPSSMGQLQRLNKLQLQENVLSGPIPETFGDLKDLQYLDLSHNNISDSIPKSLETLVNLEYFNVSFNDLSGEIPNGGPFQNLSAEFFIGNKGLCGALSFKVKKCEWSESKPSTMAIILRYILPAFASVIIIAIMVIIFLKYRGRRPSFSTLSNLFPEVNRRRRISYYEIVQATNNFDGGNLIGRGSTGSVYKGTFRDGMIATIKVFNLDMQFSVKRFDVECHIMRNIRHRNLVKIITSCSNLDFKALVMEYMPNGNLDEWLYSLDSCLTFVKRLEIMIDVATALDYLHHGCSSLIVHCDLKPNNILLDEDMVAHVADFSISKLLTIEKIIEQTRTLGTIGYMEPEYGSTGVISTMVDVYSFGILLIEVFTRRKPTDEMFTAELTMGKWVSEMFPMALLQIIDINMLNMINENMKVEYERCFTWIIEVALCCIKEKPEDRCSIQDALLRLQRIKVEAGMP